MSNDVMIYAKSTFSKNFRVISCARQDQLRSKARRDSRIPRAERRWEVDDDAHSDLFYLPYERDRSRERT